MRYTAFISYSHAADGVLAEAVQRALHRFANPWYRRRALSVFRDKTSLAANPALWPAIEAALAASEWFLFMASPRSAASPWVGKEIHWWLDHRPPERMLMVLTDGDLVWDPVARDFDWTRTTAIAADLRGRFADEPLYVDLRWTRSRNDLSLRHSQFRAAILDIAAPLHGKPKEDLDGDDVRQHRRNKRWAWSAGAGLLVLFLAATVAAFYAYVQRNEAVRQRDEAIGRLYSQQLARVDQLATTDPALALEVLDETVRAAGELREFTWDLYARLADRAVFSVGGMRDSHGNAAKDSESPVFGVSADGQRLAIGSVRRTKRNDRDRAVALEVLIWDTATGAHLQTLPLMEVSTGLVPTIESVAVSADGLYVAAGAGLMDGIVKVWEIESGKEVMKADGPTARFLQFSRDGLIGVGDYGRGNFWTALGSNAAGIPFSTKYVGAIAAGADDDEIVMVTPQTIDRFSLRTRKRESAPNPNPGGVQFETAIAPGGAWIAQASGDEIRVWQAGANAAPRLFERGHREWVTALAFSSDGRLLASGGNDHSVRVWDVERGVPTLMLRGPAGRITTLAFSRDGTRLVAGAADATVFVWDIAGSPVRPAQRVDASIKTSCKHFSVDAASLVTGAASHVTLHRGAKDSRPTVLATTGPVKDCGQSADGSTLFVVNNDLRLFVIDGATGAFRARTDPIAELGSVRVSDRGDVVTAQVGARSFRAWDGRTGADLGAIEAGGTVEGLFDVLPGGEIVAQVADERGSSIGIWNTRTKERLSTVPVPKATYTSKYGSCAARRLVASSDTDELRVVDLAQRRIAWRRPWKRDGLTAFNDVTAMTFSADCSSLAIGDKLGRISVSDVANGDQKYQVAAHSGLQQVGVGATLVNADGVNTLAFSPDGRTLASGGGTAAGRGELKLWDAARGSLLATLPADSGTVTRVAFATDGRSLGVLLHRLEQSSRGPAAILEIWSARGRERALVAGLTESVENLAFAADGVRLRIEGGTSVASWDLATGALEPAVPRSSRRTPDGVPPSPRVPWQQTTVFANEHLLFVDGRDAPRRLEPAAGEDDYHSQRVRVLHAFRDGRVLSLAGNEQRWEKPAEIALWDIAAGRPTREAFEPSNVVTTLAVSPDERTFVTVGALGEAARTGFVHLWDMERFVKIRSLTGHRANVTAVAFSPDGKTLATGDADGFVRLWDVGPR